MFSELDPNTEFQGRHIGPTADDQARMLETVGASSLSELVHDIVPASILDESPLDVPGPFSESAALARLKRIAERNDIYRNYIGQGYYGTHVPNVVLRNILENPAWYTAYTPYQPEISQGRLEALLNFQTMVADLAGLDIANASLLDEGTAAAEAMTLARRGSRSKSNVFFVSGHCHPQTLEVLRTRAEPMGIELRIGDESQGLPECFGVLLQYPQTLGSVNDYRSLVEAAHAQGALVAVATDLLALSVLTPPGEWGADIAVGTAQRFGVPLGFGGPHAGFMACRDTYKRNLPGRLVGVSRDAQGAPALRLALQTREQHIRREKATSNICTAQVLLAVMAAMYAVWHGPQGLQRIARRVAGHTGRLHAALGELGLKVRNDSYFDTLCIDSGAHTQAILAAAREARINLRSVDGATLAVSLDETVTLEDVQALAGVFAQGLGKGPVELKADAGNGLPAGLVRASDPLPHPVFSRIRSETDMLRYLRGLADKDLALDRTMIPLGSCTMKLNATAEMIPVTWPEFSQIHPFAPRDQVQGYQQLIEELSAALCQITGYDAISLQPNSGAQGEYAGLLAIRAYHRANGQSQRDVCLIPASAHGTNPASAQLAGMDVVVVASDDNGNVDVEDLQRRIDQVGDRLAALMITYPSTHGVFELAITDICERVHAAGGQVYLDGANMNAMVGLAKPGKFGSDVSHLNLHKTFCIPHGGGGPGMGPIGLKAHLAPFAPSHVVAPVEGATEGMSAVSAAPYGSAGILPITWMYITMMGKQGVRQATEWALLNANYVAQALSEDYPILYTGKNGRVAHECIVDLRLLKAESGITETDIAKRLMDYGFHAPTVSFPVAGTLMIEPTESESKAELDRFIAALKAIKQEVLKVQNGDWPKDDNPLVNAPHTSFNVAAEEWTHPYSREEAVFPLAYVRENKFWPSVNRVDDVYGDRHLVCSCPPMEAYEG